MDNTEIYSRNFSSLLEQTLVAARTDFGAFFEFVFRDAEGRAVQLATIHKTWQLHLEYCWSIGKLPAILAPYAHAKTSVVTVARTAFEIGQNLNLRAKVICQNDSKAMERVMGISTLISSPRYKLLFPNVREVSKESARDRKQIARWTQHELFVQRPGFAIDPTVQAAGVLTAGAGGRSDLNVYDDVVDQKNAIDEPALRDKVANNIDHVWMGRLEPAGRVAFIGTCYHGDDYTHRILKRPSWCVLKQWISEDFKRIEQEVYNAPDDYPIPAAVREPVVFQTKALESSNIAEFSYDPRSLILDIRFKTGTHYNYFDVPQDLYVRFAASTSKGSFFALQIKDRFKFKRLDRHAPKSPALY